MTGCYFDEPQVASLAEALRAIRIGEFNSQRLREHALTFAPNRFSERLLDLVRRIRDGERPIPIMD